MRNITFNVSQEWFDKYKSGLKDKEYRAITAYWVKRLITMEDNTVAHQMSEELPTELMRYDSLADTLDYFGCSIKEYDTVTICLGYPAKDDLERRITFKYLSTSIGYAEAGIGKELMGDDLVFVIQMERTVNF